MAEAKTTTSKTKSTTTSKKEVATKQETKKTATTKKAVTPKKEKTETTTTTKKPATKKTTTKPIVNVKHITSTKIDPRTGLVKTTAKKPKEEKVETKPVIVEDTTKKKITKKRPTKKAQELTIEPEITNKPKEIVRPTPKKVKQWNKEEKQLLKKLDESFSTVANMTMVIEERTMDKKNIPDLTIGELHLIEMVNRYNNKPMTLIANQLHITVGAMTICLNRLVQKGYLLRTRDEMDRRVILLSVTPEGKKVLKFHNKFHDDILGIVLDTIPLATAVKVMNQFAYVLELYYNPSLAETNEKKTSKKEKR